MRDPDAEALIEHLLAELGPDGTVRGGASSVVSCLVVAALLTSSSSDLLRAALRVAAATGDRQFVAIADAYVCGDHERVDALARDHLVDHAPRPVLVWMLARAGSTDQPSDQP